MRAGAPVSGEARSPHSSGCWGNSDPGVAPRLQCGLAHSRLPRAGGATSGTVMSPHLQAEEPEKPSRNLRRAKLRRGAVQLLGREGVGRPGELIHRRRCPTHPARERCHIRKLTPVQTVCQAVLSMFYVTRKMT